MTRAYMNGERQAIIVLGGIISGLGLYITTRSKTGVDLDLVFASIIALFYFGKTMMLTGHIGPISKVVSVSAAITALFTLLAYQYAVHVGYNAELTGRSDAIFDFIIAVHTAYFLIIAAAQTWMEEGKSLPYSRLFENVWNNLIISVFPFIFIGLFFGALYLAHMLLSLVDITFIEDLLEEAWFSFMLAGFLFGLTVIYLRDHDKFMGLSRRFVLAMARIVGLVLCTAAIVFVLYLPIAGFDKFWASHVAAAVMLTVVIVTGIYANAYVADGEGESWRDVGDLRKWLVTAAVAALSLFAVLGLWAFKIRIGEYGLTPDRVLAYPVFGVALVGALGYLAQIIRFRLGWAQHVSGVNKGIAALIVVTALGFQLAPFTAFNTAAKSQYNAIMAGEIKEPDFHALKFRMAAPGREYFGRLAEDTETLKAHGYSQAYERAVTATSWWNSSSRPVTPVDWDGLTLDAMQHAYKIYAGEFEISDEDLLNGQVALAKNMSNCRGKLTTVDTSGQEKCLLLLTDLNGDGYPEFVGFSRRYSSPTQIAYKTVDVAEGSAAKWDIYNLSGKNYFTDDEWKALKEALETGDFKVKFPMFKNIMIDGKTYVASTKSSVSVEFKDGKIVESDDEE